MEQNKKVFIRGNATRCKEVIAKLVALGGKDAERLKGDSPNWIYYINSGNIIDGRSIYDCSKSFIEEYQEIELDDIAVPVSQYDRLNIQNGLNIQPRCITFSKGTNIKICNEDGNIMVIIEPKEVKEEEPKFKKGDVMFLEVQGDNKIYQHLSIVKNADKDSIYFHVDLCLNENGLTIPKGDYWFSNVDIKSIRFATEEEKRTLFLAMLNKGLFFDENKMKVRTLKDGDIITINETDNDRWYSIFYRIEDGELHTYADLCKRTGKLFREIAGLCKIDQISSIAFSTTEERQALFDKIEEQEHKKWNAEKKRFEDFKWRAKNGQKYWYVNEYINVESCLQHGSVMDTDLGDVNNKFETKELAEAAANKIKELLCELPMS